MVKYKDVIIDWYIDYDDRIVSFMVMNSDSLATKEVSFDDITYTRDSFYGRICQKAKEFAEEYAEELKRQAAKEYEEEYDYDGDHYYGDSAYTHERWIS